MITEFIYAHARATPQRTAVVWNGVPVSYAHFAHGIELLRTSWQPLALPPGSVAIVVVHSLLDCWIAVLALQTLGLVTVCTRSLKEAQALGLRKVSCILLCPRKLDENRADLARWPAARPLSLPVRAQGLLPALSSADAFQAGGGHILLTSGTTGTPKKVFHDAALDAARCEARMRAEGLDAQTVLNTVNLGLWTAVGYCRALPVWSAGGCMVFDQTSLWAQNLGKHGVTHVNTVTGKLAEALQVLGPHAARRHGWDFRLAVGGSFLAPELAQRAREHLAPQLGYAHASTELWLATLRSQVQTPDDLEWLPPWGDRVVEVAAGDGTPCPDGVEGLLRVRLTELDYNGYLDAPESTARAFRDGWFYPGDLAVRRADGRIRVLGRAADVINVGGTKKASGPIEETVRAALGVNAVCAFSGPGPDGGDMVVLAIETHRPIDPGRLQHAGREFAGVARVRFVQLPTFPRTQTGTLKIDRITLRRHLEQHLRQRAPHT